jgi:PAS domain S-box-containing protein
VAILVQLAKPSWDRGHRRGPEATGALGTCESEASGGVVPACDVPGLAARREVAYGRDGRCTNVRTLHWLPGSVLVVGAAVAAAYGSLPFMSHLGGGAGRRLRAHPSSVATARRVVRDALTLARRDDLVEAAQLLVSEVVTNALVHAGTPIDFQAWVGDAGLRVEVTDGSTQTPTRRSYGAMAGTGRGLRLLEQMVDRWGTLAREDGKTVWFELSSGYRLEHVTFPVAPDPVAAVNLPDASGHDMVDVVLLNVPLLLHAAWHQHAEELLREYLLASLDADDATEALERHAAASGAMSLLHEHLLAPDLGEHPEALMATAVEPGVSAERLVLPVPRTSVTHFRVLDETLESALALADSGAFLTPPIQPELRALRRWLCQEVRGQARGEPTTTWSHDADAAPPLMLPPISWEDDVVNISGQALIAADDTDRIVAVSRPTCDLLAYQEPDQLLGRRLVAIIPPRYHQAHLAGFTLHLSNGRSPLLGRSVSVPALRRDGTEIVVELVVETQQMPGGRHLFLAQMRPASPSIGEE